MSLHQGELAPAAQMDAFFLVTQFVTAFFGVGFIIIPGVIMKALGVDQRLATMYVSRLFGTTLLAFSILIWLARRSSSLDFRRGLNLGLFVYYLTSLVVLILAMNDGMMNLLGWSVVGLHLVLTAWSGVQALMR